MSRCGTHKWNAAPRLIKEQNFRTLNKKRFLNNVHEYYRRYVFKISELLGPKIKRIAIILGLGDTWT